MATTIETPFVRLEECARKLGLPRVYLKREAQAGRIPCLRVCCGLLFRTADVEAALLEKSRGTLSATTPAGAATS
jgi:hypothetical protein